MTMRHLFLILSAVALLSTFAGPAAAQDVPSLPEVVECTDGSDDPAQECPSADGETAVGLYTPDGDQVIEFATGGSETAAAFQALCWVAANDANDVTRCYVDGVRVGQ